jgi:hypothetical protein
MCFPASSGVKMFVMAALVGMATIESVIVSNGQILPPYRYELFPFRRS